MKANDNFLNPILGVPAIYSTSRISDYNNNPLIAALPPLMSQEEIIKRLTYKVAYSENERNYTEEERWHLTNNILKFFQPLGLHVELSFRFSSMIRAGYEARNPMEKGYYQWMERRLQYLRQTNTQKSPVSTTASGTTILGWPGVGKSKAVEAILSLYDQVVIHSKFNDKDFHFVQVVWLLLQCQHDLSLRGLCLNFFRELDVLLGTDYFENFGRKGSATVDEMLIQMARVGSLHALGALCIDETQFLNIVKSGGSQKMLNFFVQLVNVMNLPVVLIGTPDAADILGTELHQGRRSCGQGSTEWKKMDEDDTWDFFIECLWRYQYTHKPSPLTRELSHKMYQISRGITDILVRTYMFAQRRAIMTGIEEITSELIDAVVADDWYVAHPALKALYLRDNQNRMFSQTAVNNAEVHSAIDDNRSSEQKKDSAKTLKKGDTPSKPLISDQESLPKVWQAAKAGRTSSYEALKVAGYIGNAEEFYLR